MLAHLASLVPLGNVAVRINFSSALFAALASAMLTLVVAELIITASYLPKTKERGARKKTKTADSAVDPVLIFAPAVGAGLVMAFSRTLWSYATIAEVYTLNTLLILTVFFLMLRWRRCIVADQTNISSPITIHDSWLYAAALVFGLALGVHHVTVGTDAPGSRRSRLQDRGPEIFYEPPVAVCRIDFDRRPGRCLCLFAVCSLAITGH